VRANQREGKHCVNKLCELAFSISLSTMSLNNSDPLYSSQNSQRTEKDSCLEDIQAAQPPGMSTSQYVVTPNLY